MPIAVDAVRDAACDVPEYTLFNRQSLVALVESEAKQKLKAAESAHTAISIVQALYSTSRYLQEVLQSEPVDVKRLSSSECT
jgi:hypothetical protein